jgi:hypothetical protein
MNYGHSFYLANVMLVRRWRATETEHGRSDSFGRTCRFYLAGSNRTGASACQTYMSSRVDESSQVVKMNAMMCQIQIVTVRKNDTPIYTP